MRAAGAIVAADGGVGGDGQAVAAFVAFQNYGQDSFFIPADPLPAIRTSYHLATTQALEAGSYDLTVALLSDGTAAGTDIDLDVEIDGFSLGAILVEAGRIGGGFLLSGTVPWVFGAGTHTVEYFAWHPAGPGTARAVQCFTTWIRRT